jgi:hypothetical protein
MRKVVQRVIAECEDCARNKAAKHRPYGRLKSPGTPERAWDSVAMDFIVKLPLSKEPMTGVRYDSIWVLTDRLTKFAYFIPFREDSTAEDFAYVFQRTILSNHQMPREIISDRDKLFTSKFWQTLTAQLGTNHKLSTSYHPQTDGQTERINQVLQQYLRFYVDFKQENWVRLLPMAQYSLVFMISHASEQPKCLMFDSGEVKTSQSQKFFELSCHYLTYDGKLFGEVTTTVRILEFHGIKKITSLEIYPLLYHATKEKIT